MTGGPALAAAGVAAGTPASVLAPAPNGPSPSPSARAAAPRFCLTAVEEDAGTDREVHLSWLPSAPSGEDLAVAYRPEPGGAVSVTSTAVVAGLKGNTAYDFWLVTSSKDQEAVSNTVRVTIPAKQSQAPLPSAWFCLTAVAGDGQVQLSWFPSAAGAELAVYGGTEPDRAKPSGLTRPRARAPW
jgi:hypothetical protein